jgi:predicted TPR repeat methyltransferase
MREHRVFALGVSDHLGVGVTLHQADDLPLAERLVHEARARPEDHRATGDLLDVTTEVAVGREEDRLVFRDRADDLLGVRRRDDVVALGLHRGRAVDVADGHGARVPVAPLLEARRGAAVGERAAGLEIGHDDDAIGVQDLRRLGHEVHAGEADHVGLGAARGLRELQRITEEVGDVLDVAILVVVREDDGVPLFLEADDLGLEVERRVDGTLRRAHTGSRRATRARAPGEGRRRVLRFPSALRAAEPSIPAHWRDALPRLGIFETSDRPAKSLAEALAAGGERVAAMEAYRELLLAAPDDLALLGALSLVLGRLGRDDEDAAIRGRIAVITVDAMGLAVAERAPAIAFELAINGLGPAPSRMPAGYVTGHFDAFAPAFDETLRSVLRYRAPELVFAALSSARGDRTSLDVCDVGCGTGLLAPLLRPLARRLDGVDLSARMLDRARELSLYDELIEAELVATLALRADRYDVIAAADVLIYLGDLGPMLAATAGALRVGGLAVFSVEHTDDPDYRLADGRYQHSPALVRAAAHAAGLGEVSMTEGALRSEQGRPVAGRVWAFSRRG